MLYASIANFLYSYIYIVKNKVQNAQNSFTYLSSITYGLLICTLIYENQGLEKSRSISNPRKISGSANLDIFSGLV